MTKDTKITGVKIIIERDYSDEWEDLTPYVPDDAMEAFEQMLDQMEDAMNMDIQLQKVGGLH